MNLKLVRTFHWFCKIMIEDVCRKCMLKWPASFWVIYFYSGNGC
ncbi:hypothetical protein PITC_069280 [Penicillium italicum]|uniref:Uncharacterized protein n=1 Tax=Penicillium italicum TaxID=40296 RepID=A0A0A2LQD4_PENIT|nr:hypothetical protein PITC_069280 [Penicillium italicum]